MNVGHCVSPPFLLSFPIMNSRGICLLPLALAPLGAAAALSFAYEPAPFSHYQPILDRMPFGTPPPDAPPDTSAEDLALQKTAEQEKAEQQQIAKQLSFSALNITPKGTIAVGFTDRSANPPQSHYLGIGDTAQGWTVLAADYDEDWARFEKDGVTVTMHLTRGLLDDSPSTEATASATNGTVRAETAADTPPEHPSPAVPGLVRLSSSRLSPRGGAATPENAPPPSYLERLRERREKMEANRAASEAAAKKAERESLQDLARKIAQDEMAKREQENAETAAALEDLRLQQEIFQARQQEEEAAKAEAEALAAQPEPEGEPAPEPEQE